MIPGVNDEPLPPAFAGSLDSIPGFPGVTARCAFTPGYFLAARIRGLKPNRFREKIWVMTRQGAGIDAR